MTILIAFAWTIVAVGLARGAFDYRLPGLAVIAVYLVAYWLVDRVRNPRRPEDDLEPDPDYSQWPTSGPIGRFGQRGLLVPWYVTNALALVNPLQALQVLRQVGGQVTLQARARQRGTDGSEYRNKTRYTLPFHGEWLVYNGGVTRKTSHSWDVLGQRFALDFVQADGALARHTGRGVKPEEYFCYGAEILAAADGVVVAAENRVGLAPLLGWGFCDFTARTFIGNHVIIGHADGEFALYAHMIKGSVTVGPGDRVHRGQVIGCCGHTGHSSEPHLHFHLQDAADVFTGMGLPVAFSGVEVDGASRETAYLQAGNRVRSREAAATSPAWSTIPEPGEGSYGVS